MFCFVYTFVNHIISDVLYHSFDVLLIYNVESNQKKEKT